MIISDYDYVVICGWMIPLCEKPEELIILSIIFQNSQDDNCLYCGSYDYLAAWADTTPEHVKELISNLINRNLVVEKILDYGYEQIIGLSVNMDYIEQLER